MNYIVAIVLFTLAGCTTLETSIQGMDTDYKKVPVSVEKSFRKKSITMGEYSLVHNSNINVAFPIFNIYHSKRGAGYSFYANNQFVSGVEITTETTRIGTKNSNIETAERTITYTGADRSERKFSVIGRIADSMYIVFQDSILGIISFEYYRSGKWNPITGFTILINGEEYGIFGFYKNPALYIRNQSKALDDKSNSRLALYILSAYQSYQDAPDFSSVTTITNTRREEPRRQTPSRPAPAPPPPPPPRR
ncbi:hypothetical protein FACS1894172_10310 [Spirochaetia bacterium]|nr:hypothetical protein FACS1894164_12970 [Spirochaetia bacterium]GHU32876.1 hypothetical protein FACS1894172_10310 [Spirochaetia bacterium]